MAVDQGLRVGLHRAWGQRCAYCYDFVFFDDLQIDHIIPETTSGDRLRSVVREQGLARDYDVHATYNLVPADHCNMRKWAHAPPVTPAMSLLFAKARRLAPKAERFARRLRQRSTLEEALAVVETFLRSGSSTAPERQRVVDQLTKVTAEIAAVTGGDVEHIGISRVLQPDFVLPTVTDPDGLVNRDDFLDMLAAWFEQETGIALLNDAIEPTLAELRNERRRLGEFGWTELDERERAWIERQGGISVAFDMNDWTIADRHQILVAEPKVLHEFGHSDDRRMFAARVGFELEYEYIDSDGAIASGDLEHTFDLWVALDFSESGIRVAEIADSDGFPWDPLDGTNRRSH